MRKPDSIVQCRVSRIDLARICAKLEQSGQRLVFASEIVQAAVETVANSIPDIPPMNTEEADEFLSMRLRTNLNPGNRAIKSLVNNLLMPKHDGALDAEEIKAAIKKRQGGQE